MFYQAWTAISSHIGSNEGPLVARHLIGYVNAIITAHLIDISVGSVTKPYYEVTWIMVTNIALIYVYITTDPRML
jgi:hypothetical protein